MCLTLVCIPITRHKGQQSPVPSSSSLRPPSCGTAQAASALNHLSTALVQTIPPTTSFSTRAVLSYHVSLNTGWPSPCQTGVWLSAGVTVACTDPVGGQSTWMWVFPGRGLQPQHIWHCASPR